MTRIETAVDPNIIDHAPELKIVARAAVGIGNIDLDYATEKGILVMNTPGKNTNSAAELTLVLCSGYKTYSRVSSPHEARWLGSTSFYRT